MELERTTAPSKLLSTEAVPGGTSSLCFVGLEYEMEEKLIQYLNLQEQLLACLEAVQKAVQLLDTAEQLEEIRHEIIGFEARIMRLDLSESE